jgi:hypothetical protein
MRATLQTKAPVGIGNRHENPYPCVSIDVVFMPPTSFELRVKNMDSTSTGSAEENATARSITITPQREDALQGSNPINAASFEPKLSSGWRSPSEMFKTALINASQESEIFDASLRALNHRKPSDNSMPELKLVEFCVELPAAKIVQLAADFTDWDEFPLDMMRFDDGIWSMTVPLPAGIYFYRFLVDGEWYDDPRAAQCDPNRAGSARAFVQIK